MGAYFQHYQNEQKQEGRQDESCEGVGHHSGRLFFWFPEQMLNRNRFYFMHLLLVHKTWRRGGVYLDLWFGDIKGLGLSSSWSFFLHKLQNNISLPTDVDSSLATLQTSHHRV